MPEKITIEDNEESLIDNVEEVALEAKEAKILEHLLKDVPDEKVKKGIESFILGVKISKHHQGPIPSPDDLANYGKISPNLVDRIVGMAEKEQLHRHRMDDELITIQKTEQKLDSDLRTKKLGGELKEAKRGQWFALTFVCLALGLGFVAIMSGYQWGGAILGAIGVAAIVTSFIQGRFSSQLKTDNTSSVVKEKNKE